MFTKRGISFPAQHSIVEVMENNHQCENCKHLLNLMESINGIIKCQQCGNENFIDLENKND